ncbi:hypothetical protein L6164_032764 [Bauhinia variegata]|uniref:Uncharacterized protein n=2 Tax=Bauhinia variegata TaxID=167791 RepID=A0ACB9KQJ4_BAUVA|nr:hypothetical protein L6164_032764 [Bauhinia variegata]
MPATAGRVRMPANNRVHSSAALQTHGIWQSAIGYDPYAPNKEDKNDPSIQSSNADPNAENAYASFQGLLALARITGSNADVDRGACKKCGRVGHLKFQCKNYVKVKDDNEEKDPEAIQLPSLVALDKLKGSAGKMDKRNKYESSEDSEEEEEDSDSSDSEVDSEIERIIAERSGRKISRKGGSSRKKRDSDEAGSDTDCDKRKKRGRSKRRRGKRESSDSDDSEERRSNRRREHRRKRNKSSDKDDERKQRKRKSRKEKRRRRSCRSDSDSESSEDSRHKRKSRRAASSSDTDSSGSDDNRISRDVKRAEKSRRHHHKDDK